MFAWHDTPWMWLSMVVFWSLFAVLVYHLISGRTQSPTPWSGPTAAEILEERFARGEISVEEYGERREVLAGTRPPSST